MEKIQTKAILPVQANVPTSRYAAGEAGTAFDSLLKEQSQAADGTAKKDSLSADDSGKTNLSGGKNEASQAVEAKGTDKEKETAELNKTADLESNLIFAGMMLPISEMEPPVLEGAEELMNPVLEAETAGETTVVGTVAEEWTAEAVLVPSEDPGITGPEEAATETSVSGGFAVGQEEFRQAVSEEVPAGKPEEVFSVSGETASAGASRPAPVESRAERTFFPEETSPERVFLPDEKTSGSAEFFEQRNEGGLKQESSETVDTGKAQEIGTREESRTEAETEPQFFRAADIQPRSYSIVEPEAEVSVPVKTTSASLVDDVGEALAQKFPQSNGTLTIELEPASLGRLTIKVLYEDGKATVSILSNNPKTLELLNARATELASILEERTGQETIIYTQPSEQEPPFEERQGEERQGNREPGERERREENEQNSFAQQLRLGLI